MSAQIPCKVCGSPNARFNYNARVCTSCASFFLRCSRLNQPHRCRMEGDCPIDVSSKKGLFCKGCRYKKCVDIGMEIKIVVNLKKRDHAPKVHTMALIKRQVDPAISLGYKYAATATDNMGAVKCAQFYGNLNKLITLQTTYHGEIHEYNLNVTLSDVLLDTGCCYSKDVVRKLSPNAARPLYIIHSYVRAVADVLNLTTAIPEFVFLSDTDRLLLLQNNYYMLLLLRLLDEFYTEKDPFELQEQLIEQCKALSNNHLASLKMIIGFFRSHAWPTFRQTDISREEIVLLQLISCFFQYEECSEEGKEAIRNARNKYINLLKEYHKHCLLGMAEKERSKRLSTLMHFLGLVKDASVQIGQSFNSQIANNEHFMLGRLTYELCMGFEKKCGLRIQQGFKRTISSQ